MAADSIAHEQTLREAATASEAGTREEQASPGKLLEDESGMTMIEVLTALVILSMVSIILYAFLFMGISMYKRVTAETQIRNQGDAVISQVISELKDAIYVKAEGTGNLEIRYVKRATDPDVYVEEYIMKIDESNTLGSTKLYGISVARADEPGKIVKRFDLTSPYSLSVAEGTDPPISQLSVSGADSNHQIVNVTLEYKNMQNFATSREQMENPGFEVKTSIPLFRFE